MAYESIKPALVLPDHFYCNQRSTVVAIYTEGIVEESQRITLQFPGDVVGSAAQTVVPQRVDCRTLVFETPVYSTGRTRGMVEVQPMLSTTNGDVKLAAFQIAVRHPVKDVIELCMRLSSSEAVLPVLMSLMLHCHDDKCKEYFQDPQMDRIMTTLVGSRTPGACSKIMKIILPEKKWRGLKLEDFARKFELTEMEKQAYVMKTMTLSHHKKAKGRTLSHATTDELDSPADDENSCGRSLPSPSSQQRSQALAAGSYVQLTKQPPQLTNYKVKPHNNRHPELPCNNSGSSEGYIEPCGSSRVDLFNPAASLPPLAPSSQSKKRPPKVPVKLQRTATPPESPPQRTKKWHSTEILQPREQFSPQEPGLRCQSSSPHQDPFTAPVLREKTFQFKPSDRSLARELREKYPGFQEVAGSHSQGISNRQPQAYPASAGTARRRDPSNLGSRTGDYENYTDSESLDSYDSVVDTDEEADKEAKKPIPVGKKWIPASRTQRHDVMEAISGHLPVAVASKQQHEPLVTKLSHRQRSESPQPKPRNLPKLREPISQPMQGGMESASESDEYVDVDESLGEPTYINTTESVYSVDDHVYDDPDITRKAPRRFKLAKQPKVEAPALPPPNTRLKPTKKRLKDSQPTAKQVARGGGVSVFPQSSLPRPEATTTRDTPPRDILRTSTPPPVIAKKPRGKQASLQTEPGIRKVPILPPPGKQVQFAWTGH